jgi:predicted nucleic acid-binding protein
LIYLDTSVVLAHLLAEDRSPPPEIWKEVLISSRLLEYEVWVRIHARGLGASHAEATRSLLDRIYFLEFARPVLERALEPFPLEVRTLDALHLAAFEFIRRRGFEEIELATYDVRMRAVARELGISIHDLP